MINMKVANCVRLQVVVQSFRSVNCWSTAPAGHALARAVSVEPSAVYRNDTIHGHEGLRSKQEFNTLKRGLLSCTGLYCSVSTWVFLVTKRTTAIPILEALPAKSMDLPLSCTPVYLQIVCGIISIWTFNRSESLSNHMSTEHRNVTGQGIQYLRSVLRVPEQPVSCHDIVPSLRSD